MITVSEIEGTDLELLEAAAGLEKAAKLLNGSVSIATAYQNIMTELDRRTEKFQDERYKQHFYGK